MVGSLVGCTRTIDQAKAVLTFAEAIAEKTLRSTVALTAGRGRGKSAALGLAIAAAVGYGYSNIFVTSPSPENLRTLFDFVFKVSLIDDGVTVMRQKTCYSSPPCPRGLRRLRSKSMQTTKQLRARTLTLTMPL